MTDKKKPAAKRQSARVPRTKAKAAPKREARRSRPVGQLPADLVEHFGAEMIDLVRDRLPGDATDADLVRLLLEARRLNANPVRGGLYLKPAYLRDAAAPQLTVVASRDVLLAFAESQPSFRDHDEDAIYENDTFERVVPVGDALTLRERAGVLHLQGHPKDRGALVGAWCAVEVRGRAPVYFQALCAEYLPPEELAAMDQEDPRRKHPDRFMVAKAMCWPLRVAFSLNDVVGAEEISDFASRRQAPEPAPAPAADLQPLDDLDAEVVGLFAAWSEHRAPDGPPSWDAAIVRGRLVGSTSDADRRALADELRASVVAEREAAEARMDELEAIDAQDLDEDARDRHAAEVAAVGARIAGLVEAVVAPAAA